MTQLYVLSQDGTSAINLSQFEYYRSRYIDAAKTAQYIEIGQISAGDAEHVTTLCKKAAIEYKTAA